MLPISLYAIVYAAQNDLLTNADCLYAFFYMLVGLLFTQQLVVRMSGMPNSEFLRNARRALFGKN